MKRVIKLHSARGPWLNFGNMNPEAQPPEVVFTKRFINAYRKGVIGDGVGIREFSVQGLGIADFLWITKGGKSPRLIAFELKLKDWSKGLAQAYRYSYFSDESYLVVPNRVAENALKCSIDFDCVNVGLIGFSENESSITIYQTPKKKGHASQIARSRAIKNLISNYNLCFLAKGGDRLRHGL